METKLIVFDMDGTLYYIGDLVLTNYNIATSYLVEKYNYTKEEAKKLFDENDIYPYVTGKDKSTTQLFKTMGLNIDWWDEMRNERFDPTEISLENAIDQDTIEQFMKHCPCVLLTNNTMTNVKLTLDRLNISPDAFDKIYCADDQGRNPTKMNTMDKIIKEYGVKPEETISIGDRYNIDGLPMLKLGGRAIIVKRPVESFPEILKDFDNFKTSEKYEYYDRI